MSRGTEIAGTTLVVFALGFFVDRWLDTKPLFMIALTVVALLAQFAKLYFAYTAQMDDLESQRRIAREGRA
jgi:F0F1-type ATP synthase assembly protein I